MLPPDNREDFLEKFNKTPSDELSKAFSDREGLEDKDREKQSKKNEHGRKESSRTIFHWGNIAIIVALYVAMTGGIIALAIHLVLPQEWNFLTDAQLDTIKNILFSALATNYAKESYRKNILN